MIMNTEMILVTDVRLTLYCTRSDPFQIQMTLKGFSKVKLHFFVKVIHNGNTIYNIIQDTSHYTSIS